MTGAGVWSYIVGAITTPLYIIIPLLTIWVGVFPIAISWWAALALTMYYIAQSLVLNYCKKVRWNPWKTLDLVQHSHTHVHGVCRQQACVAARHDVPSRWHLDTLQSACTARTSTQAAWLASPLALPATFQGPGGMAGLSAAHPCCAVLCWFIN